MTRREFVAVAACSRAICHAAASNERSFWLFRLLRPECVMVHPVGSARLHCSDSRRRWIVEGNEPLCIATNAPHTRISGPDGAPVICALEVPGVIRRTFKGVFEFPAGAEYVLPVVSMDCETATGCVVGAELPVFAAPFHALAAQAVVSRSVICGTGSPRHAIADFCDTTHCQFLRSPAARASVIAQAVAATCGCVLADNGRVIPARYSAACGGWTQGGLENGYRYVPVRCEVCSEQRIAQRGHGWGLCQEGAMELARRGWGWRAILAKYYPNATPAPLTGAV